MLKKFLTYFLLLSVTYAMGQEIALTFDDAPMSNGQYFTGAKRTEALIKKLQKSNVTQVAFFATTSHIDSIGLRRLNQYAKAGHILANHSHSHQRSHLMGTAQYINDIQKADQILRTMPGFTPWYRFPFLDEGKTIATRDSLRQALAQMQYFNGYVTVDNYDWYINSLFQQALKSGKKVDLEALRKMYLTHLWNSVQFYDNMAKQTLGRSPKHVLLLHENDLAALFIDDLVQLLREKGWKIISPTDAYTDPIATSIPDVLLNGQGRVAAIAKEKGYKGSFAQNSEDEAALEKQFAQLQIAR